MDTAHAVAFFLLLFALYFSPTLLARHREDWRAIFALNLLLGWTFVGWVAALVWALRGQGETAAAPGGRRRSAARGRYGRRLGAPLI